jgi:hypothetical protein
MQLHDTTSAAQQTLLASNGVCDCLSQLVASRSRHHVAQTAAHLHPDSLPSLLACMKVSNSCQPPHSSGRGGQRSISAGFNLESVQSCPSPSQPFRPIFVGICSAVMVSTIMKFAAKSSTDYPGASKPHRDPGRLSHRPLSAVQMRLVRHRAGLIAAPAVTWNIHLATHPRGPKPCYTSLIAMGAR